MSGSGRLVVFHHHRQEAQMSTTDQPAREPADFTQPITLARQAYRQVQSEADPLEPVIVVLRRATIAYHLAHSIATLHGPDAEVPLSDQQVLALVFDTRDAYGMLTHLQVTARDAGGFLAEVDITTTGATRLGLLPWAERSGAS
jgi:hypothetical protein